MRILTIDRFDGQYALCEDSEKRMFAIVREELPEGAREGSVLEIDDDGNISVSDNDEMKKKNIELQKKLFS